MKKDKDALDARLEKLEQTCADCQRQLENVNFGRSAWGGYAALITRYLPA